MLSQIQKYGFGVSSGVLTTITDNNSSSEMISLPVVFHGCFGLCYFFLSSYFSYSSLVLSAEIDSGVSWYVVLTVKVLL